ncbi:putative inositol monophosphatase 3 isoform X2 [Paramacrobiotus metropolitanus]|uniref:putative inositol monophosphatase 3 isoform X2 n=1 Tax=Paramacrobiotus metropolitanus TaxID=2943436 RepID=UPI002445F1CA|nr:putative inositol monophosphatase 3 isoform X2 [Paramacrobiotus metropolitanus]
MHWMKVWNGGRNVLFRRGNCGPSPLRLPRHSSAQTSPFFTWRPTFLADESPADQPISLRSLLYRAILAAERGGQEVISVQNSGHLATRSKSICFNPVTLGDIRSHVAIKGTLRQAFPSLTIISEEDELRLDSDADYLDGRKFYEEVPAWLTETVPVDEVVRSGDVAVWIDPLDGTKEFTAGLYECVTVLVGIAVKGRPVAGVIHCPFPEGRTYWAWEGKGVCSHLKHVHTKDSCPNDVLRIAVSKNPMNAGEVQHFAEKAFHGRSFELVPMGGAGYKIVQVCTGAVDGYLHITRNIKKWDICAGHGLVSAMGGRLQGLCGQSVDYTAPVDMKEDVAVRTGFLCTMHDDAGLFDGCRSAVLGI